MVKDTGRGLVVKRLGVVSKVQMLKSVLGVGVFSLLPRIFLIDQGFCRLVLFLFLGLFILLNAPTRNSPKRVRDIIKTFSRKKWETPRFANISGLQKGPAERGHVKKRQKVSKSFSTIFAQGKKRQKKSVKKVFDTFRQFSRAAPFYRPLFGGL